MAAQLWAGNAAGTGGPEGAVEPAHPGRRREHEEQRAQIQRKLPGPGVNTTAWALCAARGGDARVGVRGVVEEPLLVLALLLG